jgi:hypothetical protein
MGRTGPEKNELGFAFFCLKNGIAGYKDFHDPLPMVGVYRCLGVFMGVLNTVGWMEGVILIPKRVMSGKGVNVFSRFWGVRIKFIVHLTKGRNCEIFSSKITPELVALDLVGTDPLENAGALQDRPEKNETQSDSDPDFPFPFYPFIYRLCSSSD